MQNIYKFFQIMEQHRNNTAVAAAATPTPAPNIPIEVWKIKSKHTHTSPFIKVHDSILISHRVHYKP
jgi:hypothetical protein